VARRSAQAYLPECVQRVFSEVRPNEGCAGGPLGAQSARGFVYRSSLGRTGRPSRAERFAASARALSSRAARTFFASVFPSVESSTQRPKGEPPSAGTRTSLHARRHGGAS
jgi:hypothetical protein